MGSGRAPCAFWGLLLAAAPALLCASTTAGEAPDVRASVDALRRLIVRDGALARQLDDGRLRPWAVNESGGASAVSVALPRFGARPVEARLGGFEVRLTPVGARPDAPLHTHGAWALYPEQYPSTDGFVVTGPGFLEALWLLRDEAAPTRFVLDVGAPWLKMLRLDADGGASLLTASDEVALRVRPPVAIDAEGRRVDCALHVEGTRLAVVLTGKPRAFPVVVDPVVETVGWNEQPFLGVRSSHAMAALNGDVVLFGGNDRQSLRDDTWVWDGTVWRRTAPPERPPAREGHAMATLNGKVVLFGGSRAGAPLFNDTWEWDGTTWTQKTPAVSPPARASAAMATLNGKVVLFGGFGQGSFNDTWEWDGATWTQRTPVHAPQPRDSFAMATVAGEVLLFGGCGSGVDLSDTWTWDGQDWTERTPATSPPARCDHALTSLADSALLYGGIGAGVTLDDQWRWDGSTWVQLSAAGSPGYLAYHAMAERGGKALLYGGAYHVSGALSAIYRANTWEWDGAAWVKKVPSDRPAAREDSAMATLRDKVVLFGGIVDSTVQADTWTWDGARWVRETPTASPSARYDHAMAAFDDTIVLFGGRQATMLADTWVWDGVTWTRRTPATSPPARGGHAMAALNGKLFLFGGYGSSGYRDDTWAWDGTTWTQVTPATSPPARQYHAMATVGGVIVLFGGTNNTSLSDTWTFDGTTWTQRMPPVSPSGRYWFSMVGLDDKAVLFSGNMTGFQTNDTWEWDGSGWNLKALTDAPATRYGYTMAALDGKAVLFGGRSSTLGTLTDTWYYLSDPRLANGKPCADATDCVSGFCADGVCCESACGDSAPGDCQACSVAAGAAVDGECALLPTSVECRPSGGACDVAETCTGDSPDCPADVFAPPTLQCRAAKCRGDDAVAEAWCTGSATNCPDELVLHCGLGLCAEALCDTPDAGGPDGGTPTDAPAPHQYAIGCVSLPGVALWPWLLVLLLRPRRRPR